MYGSLRAPPGVPRRGAVTPAFRPFLWLLLATALLARAFVPQGYMPERTTERTIAVAICGSGEHWAIPLGDRNENRRDTPTAVDAPCAFAGLGVPALPPAATPELPSLAPAAQVYGERAANPQLAQAARLLPPSTGPPFAV